MSIRNGVLMGLDKIHTRYERLSYKFYIYLSLDFDKPEFIKACVCLQSASLIQVRLNFALRLWN